MGGGGGGLSPARAVRGVEDFIVKYGEVEGEPQANGVCWRQLAHGDITGGFVRDQTVLRRFLPVVPCGKLRQVPVVVTLPTGREREREGKEGRGSRRQGRQRKGQRQNNRLQIIQTLSRLHIGQELPLLGHTTAYWLKWFRISNQSLHLLSITDVSN